jgi:Flp pilus assembly protein TadG
MAALNRFLKRLLRGESGAELVEFSLTLPLLLLVALGIIEFGQIFREYEVVVNAAREGARIAILPVYADTATAAQTNVTARVDQYLSTAGLATTSSVRSVCGGGVAAGSYPACSSSSWNWTSVQDPALSPGVCVKSFPVRVEYVHSVLFLDGIMRYFGGSFGNVTLASTARMRSEIGASSCS